MSALSLTDSEMDGIVLMANVATDCLRRSHETGPVDIAHRTQDRELAHQASIAAFTIIERAKHRATQQGTP